MRALNEPRIDELRDLDGSLFGRAPAQAWVKPLAVNLRQKNFRHILEGALKNGSELEFVIPWSAPRRACVKPQRNILEAFLTLGVASDIEIHGFAAKFGPLLVFCESKEFDDHAVIVESCDVWRYFAASMKSLLRIAAGIQTGRALDSSDWDVLGHCPIAILRTEVDGNNWMNPSPALQEKSWKVMASVIRGGEHRNRQMWVRLLNALLGLGRVRPWVTLETSGGSRHTTLTFTGPNLLSYLAMQLCLMASKHDAFAICSFCSRAYAPQRAAKFGQRNFCPECRQSGVPVRVAQQARRERLRGGR
jgi:hypothetical protein